MRHTIIPWLLEWTGVTLTRYVVHANGKTAYQNIATKRSKRPVAAFGEKVLYLPLETERMKMGKEEPKLREGVWLGVKMRIDEALIGTEGGVVKARTIRRLPKAQRWDAKMINKIKGVATEGDSRSEFGSRSDGHKRCVAKWRWSGRQ